MPTEKYAHAPEILEHCQRIGKQFGLYDNALFHTEVTDLDVGRRRSRAGSSAPTAATSSPPSSSAMGTGPLHVPKLPGIPGIESFSGHSFHTSRWDYDYTGGDPSGAPMDKLADKRVGHHRHRRHRGAVRAASRAGVRGAVRLPAHAVVGRRARQPADRPGVVRRDRHAGLAAALARELHRQPDRRRAPTRTS